MTKLKIRAQLDYRFDRAIDILLQVEAAMLPEQSVSDARLDVSECAHFARVAGHDGIGERVWIRAEDRLVVDYRAVVEIHRIAADMGALAAIPPHLLPGETVQYLLPSRFCPSDRFEPFVERAFGAIAGGARAVAMRDWIAGHVDYVSGSSASHTTATDTFVERRGVCRDFAHLLVTLARAGGLPARVAAVYALGVEPQDFHAVAEVFVGGEWHMLDATGMATGGGIAKIGVGRDAADIAFMTSFGPVTMNAQSVIVEAG